VQSGLIVRLRIDTFDDVNLTMTRPVRTDQPPSRPRATSLWHVIQIGNKETIIPTLVRGDSNGSTTGTAGNTPAVTTDLHGIVGVNGYQTPVEGVLLTGVVDVTMGGIGTIGVLIPEPKVVEEVLTLPRLGE